MLGRGIAHPTIDEGLFDSTHAKICETRMSGDVVPQVARAFCGFRVLRLTARDRAARAAMVAIGDERFGDHIAIAQVARGVVGEERAARIEQVLLHADFDDVVIERAPRSGDVADLRGPPDRAPDRANDVEQRAQMRCVSAHAGFRYAKPSRAVGGEKGSHPSTIERRGLRSGDAVAIIERKRAGGAAQNRGAPALRRRLAQHSPHVRHRHCRRRRDGAQINADQAGKSCQRSGVRPLRAPVEYLRHSLFVQSGLQRQRALRKTRRGEIRAQDVRDGGGRRRGRRYDHHGDFLAV